MSVLTLAPGVAHLWYVFSDEVQDPDLLAAYHALMSPDEAAKQARFYFPEGRHEYLLTRALVRAVLSRYAPIAPAAWQFIRNEHGRPEIAGPPGTPRIHFNLSNTKGLIACLVALGRDVGVDVEDTERAAGAVDIAERFFSPSEVRALRARPPDRQRERFFEYWTLKESYIKARGMGLAIPLDHFSFHLDEGPEIRISFDPRLQDRAEEWQFALYRPTARHMMATAIRKRGDAPLAVELREIVPLRGE